jgi:hypothetical protein
MGTMMLSSAACTNRAPAATVAAAVAALATAVTGHPWMDAEHQIRYRC